VAQACRALQAARKAGLIAKPSRCQAKGCTSSKHLEAHHWSYEPEHRLDVLWVCASHHRQGHAQGWITPTAGIPRHRGTIPEIAMQPAKKAA
jgi:hypothetical protein